VSTHHPSRTKRKVKAILARLLYKEREPSCGDSAQSEPDRRPGHHPSRRPRRHNLMRQSRPTPKLPRLPPQHFSGANLQLRERHTAAIRWNPRLNAQGKDAIYQGLEGTPKEREEAARTSIIGGAGLKSKTLGPREATMTDCIEWTPKQWQDYRRSLKNKFRDQLANAGSTLTHERTFTRGSI